MPTMNTGISEALPIRALLLKRSVLKAEIRPSAKTAKL